MRTDLSKYDNSAFDAGAGSVKRIAWYVINLVVFNTPVFASYGLKVFLLRLFGAKVGQGVKIKPSVNIKYPWKLELGNHVWIGERAWIDNLDSVTVGDHCCISQGALLLCGNHNYKTSGFDLITGTIALECGAWIGAGSVVCPGVTCGEHSVLTVASVATSDLLPFTIYQGNPAKAVKTRVISE